MRRGDLEGRVIPAEAGIQGHGAGCTRAARGPQIGRRRHESCCRLSATLPTKKPARFRRTMTGASLSQLLQAIRDQYQLPWWGLHGITHWARVYENGLRLAEHTEADREVLLYFALFHDAKRVNERWDDGHGRRGAEFAASLRGSYFDLSSHQFELLFVACAQHTDGLLEGDSTVQTCWDADRLDLARARIYPRPEQLCSPAARSPEVIAWATERSLQRRAPLFVEDAWATEGPGPDETRGRERPE